MAKKTQKQKEKLKQLLSSTRQLAAQLLHLLGVDRVRFRLGTLRAVALRLFAEQLAGRTFCSMTRSCSRLCCSNIRTPAEAKTPETDESVDKAADDDDDSS